MKKVLSFVLVLSLVVGSLYGMAITTYAADELFDDFTTITGVANSVAVTNTSVGRKYVDVTNYMYKSAAISSTWGNGAISLEGADNTADKTITYQGDFGGQTFIAYVRFPDWYFSGTVCGGLGKTVDWSRYDYIVDYFKQIQNKEFEVYAGSTLQNMQKVPVTGIIGGSAAGCVCVAPIVDKLPAGTQFVKFVQPGIIKWQSRLVAVEITANRSARATFPIRAAIAPYLEGVDELSTTNNLYSKSSQMTLVTETGINDTDKNAIRRYDGNREAAYVIYKTPGIPSKMFTFDAYYFNGTDYYCSTAGLTGAQQLNNILQTETFEVYEASADFPDKWSKVNNVTLTKTPGNIGMGPRHKVTYTAKGFLATTKLVKIVLPATTLGGSWMDCISKVEVKDFSPGVTDDFTTWTTAKKAVEYSPNFNYSTSNSKTVFGTYAARLNGSNGFEDNYLAYTGDFGGKMLESVFFIAWDQYVWDKTIAGSVASQDPNFTGNIWDAYDLMYLAFKDKIEIWAGADAASAVKVNADWVLGGHTPEAGSLSMALVVNSLPEGTQYVKIVGKNTNWYLGWQLIKITDDRADLSNPTYNKMAAITAPAAPTISAVNISSNNINSINISANNTVGKVIVAIYTTDNGKIYLSDVGTYDVAASNYANYVASINVNKSVPTGSTYKVMFWDSLTGIRPLCLPAE